MSTLLTVCLVVRAIIGQVSRNAAHMAVLRRKLYGVEMWTSKRHLSPALCSKIRTYYAEIWLEHNGEPPAQTYASQICISSACAVMMREEVLHMTAAAAAAACYAAPASSFPAAAAPCQVALASRSRDLQSFACRHCSMLRSLPEPTSEAAGMAMVGS